MPGLDVGIYTGQLTAGTQVSSSDEGRIIQVLESELIHPYRTSGYVNVGDPVIVCRTVVPATYGNAVGIARATATAATDYIAVDTEGIWNLTVYAENDIQGINIEIGDPLFIRAGNLPGAADGDGTGDAEISKMNDVANQVPFGYALGRMVADGSGRIAVKVHWGSVPTDENRVYMTVPTGAYSYGFHETAILTAGESTGLHYKDVRVGGQQTGGIYAFGVWMELGADFLHLDGNLLVALEGGFYESAADIGDSWIVGLQLQYMLHENPATLTHFRVNVAAAGGTMDAVFAAANPASMGLVADGAGTSSIKLGSLPLLLTGGVTYWVRLYDAAA